MSRFKGHTWSHGRGDICKCGKIHVNGLLGKPLSKKNREGISKALKGRKGNSAFRGHNYAHGRGDVCKKCGKIHVNGKQGKIASVETRQKISDAAKLRPRRPQNEETRLKIGKAVHEFWERLKTTSLAEYRYYCMMRKIAQSRIPRWIRHERTKRGWITRKRHLMEEARIVLKALYGLSEDDIFFPVKLSDHWFARNALIEKTYSSRGYRESTNLPAHPYFPLHFSGDKDERMPCELQFPLDRYNYLQMNEESSPSFKGI